MKALFKKFNLASLTVLLCSLLPLALTSCDNDDDDVLVVPDPADVAYVTLYHASPDAPPLNVFLDNQRVNYNPLPYAGYTDYLNFFPGERELIVRPAGAANAIMDTTLTLIGDQAYSLFYVNRLANIRPLLVRDSLVSPGPGKAAVRFVHLSPDAPAVSLVRNDQTANPLIGSVPYLNASPFVLVDSGEQSFQVKPAGSAAPVLSIPDVNLLPGGVYTIVARGFVTPPPGNNNALAADIILNN